MDLVYINQMLSREGLYWGSCCYEDVELKFDVTPHEYLEFMEEDLKGEDKSYISGRQHGWSKSCSPTSSNITSIMGWYRFV